jgi:hypothetical protein
VSIDKCVPLLAPFIFFSGRCSRSNALHDQNASQNTLIFWGVAVILHVCRPLRGSSIIGGLVVVVLCEEKLMVRGVMKWSGHQFSHSADFYFQGAREGLVWREHAWPCHLPVCLLDWGSNNVCEKERPKLGLWELKGGCRPSETVLFLCACNLQLPSNPTFTDE